MSTGAKQQKLPQPEIPETASIPVPLKDIPKNLPPSDRNVLLVNCDRELTRECGHTAWFRDCDEVRAVLVKHGLLEKRK